MQDKCVVCFSSQLQFCGCSKQDSEMCDKQEHDSESVAWTLTDCRCRQREVGERPRERRRKSFRQEDSLLWLGAHARGNCKGTVVDAD